jgi:hypothetical protein
MQFHQALVFVRGASSQRNSDKGRNNVIPVILFIATGPAHRARRERGP